MTEKEAHIYKWIAEISKIRPELSNFAICPFASQAKITIIETTINDIEPISGFDVVIFVVEDKLTLKEITQWVDIYNRVYPKQQFFEDCKSYDTYLQGIQTNNARYNLVLCQSREKLRKYRNQLANTEYYSNWEESFLQEILGNDYDLIKN